MGKKDRTVYAITNENPKKILMMHRLVLRFTDADPRIDHRDRNGLDNRKGNLRVATPSQNGGNRITNRNSSTGFKGVTLRRDCIIHPWRVRIMVMGKAYIVGNFSTLQEAALAYDVAALERFGEFARLNFPSQAATMSL